jgi:hypothetical protein
MSGLDDAAIPLLSAEWTKARKDTYAFCHGCNSIYIDDLPNYGSIICPVCSLDVDYMRCVRRRLSEEEAAQLLESSKDVTD